MLRPPPAAPPARLLGPRLRPNERLERALLGTVMSVMALVLERRLATALGRGRSVVSS